MAVAEFLHNFRMAAMFLAPWEYEGGQFPQADLDENAKRYWKLWLNRSAVEGLDPALFASLTAAQKEAVEKNKRLFLDNVPSDGEPPIEQLNHARRAFLTLFQLVGKNLFDPVIMKAAKVLRSIVQDKKYGNWFVGVDFALGDDSTGDPALWAWLIVADDTPDAPKFQTEWPQLRRWVREDLRDNGIPDRYAFLSLRTASEQEEMLRGEVE